jgi:hypothetical protein
MSYYLDSGYCGFNKCVEIATVPDELRRGHTIKHVMPAPSRYNEACLRQNPEVVGNRSVRENPTSPQFADITFFATSDLDVNRESVRITEGLSDYYYLRFRESRHDTSSLHSLCFGASSPATLRTARIEEPRR